MDILFDGFYPQVANEVITSVLFKATVLLSGAWLLTLLLRRASAAFRYVIWSLALCGLLVMPVISALLTSWKMDLRVAVPEIPLVETPLASPLPLPTYAPPPASLGVDDIRHAPSDAQTFLRTDALVEAPHEILSSPKMPRAAARSPWQIALVWVLRLWLLGASILLIRLLVDVVHVAWITRRARILPEGPHLPVLAGLKTRLPLRRPVRILYSHQISMPLMWGLWRPVIILPEEAHSWSQERLRLVLIHELAHVKRCDYLSHLVAQIVWSLYWLNPLAWVATRRVSLEQERACDDLVLKTGMKASTYAEHLLDLSRALQRHGSLVTTMAMAKRSTLKERIRAILNRKLDRRAPTVRAGFGSALVITGLLIPVSALHLQRGGKQEIKPEVQRMIAALEDADPEVRQRAAWSLGEQEAPQAVEDLIERLQDRDPGVRGMVAWSLGEIKDRRALQPLIAGLPDKDQYVKEMVIRALGELEDERAVDALIATLEEASPELRAATAWALGEIKGSRALEALAQMVRTDPDVHARKAAAEALRPYRSPRTLLTFVTALHDESPKIRTTAILALADLGDRRAIPPLIAVLQGDPHAEVRMLAAVALGHLDDPLALSGLLAGLNDPEPIVREKSAHALGTINDARAVDALMLVLRDPHPSVRAMAIWALDEISL